MKISEYRHPRYRVYFHNGHFESKNFTEIVCKIKRRKENRSPHAFNVHVIHHHLDAVVLVDAHRERSSATIRVPYSNHRLVLIEHLKLALLGSDIEAIFK